MRRRRLNRMRIKIIELRRAKIQLSGFLLIVVVVLVVAVVVVVGCLLVRSS